MKDNTRNRIMRITSVPTGQAPLHIREKWIGVEIPFIELKTPQGPVCGVVDGGLVKVGNSFIVDQVAALTALREKSPEAADWWADVGYPIPGAQFTFNAECAEVVG